MAITVPAAGATPPVPPMGALAISPTWAELLTSLQCMFTDPRVNFAILSASSTDGPDSLLMRRVEALACHPPVILALVSNEEPNQITLLNNPCQYTGSLANPSPVDNHMYSFTGMDAQNLAAVHLPPSAFKTSDLYNVLNNAAAIQVGLDMLPQDQSFHPHVSAMTLGMTNSACQHTIVLPMEWHQKLVEHFPHGINLKSFYNCILSTVGAGEHQTLDGVFTWWNMQHQGLPTLQGCAQDCKWTPNRPYLQWHT